MRVLMVRHSLWHLSHLLLMIVTSIAVVLLLVEHLLSSIHERRIRFESIAVILSLHASHWRSRGFWLGNLLLGSDGLLEYFDLTDLGWSGVHA